MAVRDLRIIGQLSTLNDCLDFMEGCKNTLLCVLGEIAERYDLGNGRFMFKIQGDNYFRIQLDTIKKVSFIYPELLFIADNLRIVEGMPV